MYIQKKVGFQGLLKISFAILFLIPVLAYMPRAAQRLLDSETNLGIIESRIGSIPDALERWSPAYLAAWEGFKQCMEEKGVDCDASLFIEARERAVDKDWPEVFVRLKVYQDWGERYESAAARDEFFEAVQKKGEKYIRQNCRPIIKFRSQSWGHARYFHGYDCKDGPDLTRSGPLFMSNYVQWSDARNYGTVADVGDLCVTPHGSGGVVAGICRRQIPAF